MRDALQPLFRCIMCSSIVAAASLLITAAPVFANKTSVSISAPESAAPGSAITIRVTATHSANNFLHHTDWLYIMVNGQEIARWDYSWRNKPEGSVFTKEITYVPTGSIDIQAEGHCNMHGSKGPATATVSVTGAAN
jgi:desulfoferrodoxin (superoxide reductase-like protein)